MRLNVRKLAGIAGLAALLTAPAFAGQTEWKIDPQHSSVQFAVPHLMISTVHGVFHGVDGTIVWDDKDITKSKIDVTIDVNSVDTREADRDKHLKSADFFDAGKYPTMTFKSTKIEEAGPGKLKVTGDLTLRGVTKQVTLEVAGPKSPIKDPWGLTRTAASATGKINRQDFGVKFNQNLDNGGVMVGDNVDLILDVELIVPPAKK